MSIRLRLTLLYSGILALTLIAFSAALYYTLSRVTLGVLAGTLEDEAKRLLDAKVFVIDANEFRLDRIVLPSKLAAPDTYVQTLEPDGGPTARTANLIDFDVYLPLSAAGQRAVQRGASYLETTSLKNQRFLIYSRPVTIQGLGLVGIVQVARSLEQQDRSLDALRIILIIGSSLATVLACGVGWILAGTALRPIDRITHTAHEIGVERDFGRRVPYTGPADEIGRLATTFNTMLAQLQAAYTQEAQALQAQRRFVADASHELRTPLTTIRGNIGLLQREPPISAEDRVAVLADMVDESERMSRLVNDLLVLARADAGRTLRRETVPIKPLIEDLCRTTKLLDPQRTITCEPLQDVAVTGDPDAIKQVLLILLDNALKFTPSTQAIAVTSAVDAGRVAISVRDTGPGIPPEALPHIFERFYRGDTARTGAGAGLGLAIAKTLVEGQQGTISVESQVGQGSTFTVSFLQAAMIARETETLAAVGSGAE